MQTPRIYVASRCSRSATAQMSNWPSAVYIAWVIKAQIDGGQFETADLDDLYLGVEYCTLTTVLENGNGY